MVTGAPLVRRSEATYHGWLAGPSEALKLTAQDLLKAGLVDVIVSEPPGGAHTNPAAMAATLSNGRSLL